MSSSKYHIRAIDTEHSGYFFRSRLEARWAIFFEKADIKYRYEPEGVNLDGVRYLPDFFLPELNFWVEVKPDRPTEQERDKAIRLCVASKQNVVILAGEVWNNAECFCYLPVEPDIAKRGLAELEKNERAKLWWVSASQFIYVDDEGGHRVAARKPLGFIQGRNCRVPQHSIWGHTCFSACSACGKIGLYEQIGVNACVCRDKSKQYSTPHLIAAYTAARQARFEHGPKVR